MVVVTGRDGTGDGEEAWGKCYSKRLTFSVERQRTDRNGNTEGQEYHWRNEKWLVNMKSQTPLLLQR